MPRQHPLRFRGCTAMNSRTSDSLLFEFCAAYRIPSDLFVDETSSKG